MPFLPPLENGDHLTRGEFERRYDAMPELKKAELLNGVVYMPSPVRFMQHGSLHASLILWVGYYRVRTPGLRAGDNTTVRFAGDNEPQPDALLFIDPTFGRTVAISEDDYGEGGPELIGEVSASTVSIDLHTKLEVYRRNRVHEYIVWRVDNEAIDWFVLRGDQFDRLPLGADGIYRNEVFPGLWLDAAALLRTDLQRVLDVLQQGIATSEHSAFVAQLRQNAARNPTS
jgi:Uma2 family endonuclease